MVAAAAYAPPLRASITPVCSKATIPAKALYAAAGPLERPTTPAMFAWLGVTSNWASKDPVCDGKEPFCQAPALVKGEGGIQAEMAELQTVALPTLVYRPTLFSKFTAACSVRKAKLLPRSCSEAPAGVT